MKRNSRSAFTFIELLIVTCIIVALITILFPVFSQAREKARGSQCQSNLQQIGVALHVYAQDNFGKFPPKDNQLGPLYPYVQDLSIFACPTDVGAHVALRNGKLIGQSYDYKGGLGTDDDPKIAIASDSLRINHNSGANFVFLDGHVKWINRSSSARLPVLGQPYNPQPRNPFMGITPPPPSGAMGGGQ
jgi:prepilin-type processing-associated H-X9-DG protein